MKIKFLNIVLALLMAGLPVMLRAQDANKPNWQNLDLKTDGVFGISTEKAYTELLKGKKHVPVLVAVIDGGVDVNHEDLKGVIWTNPKEIAGNNTDDDKNGYADDIHGWDFIGGANGNVQYDNTEDIRILRRDKPKYENADTTKLSTNELVNYHKYVAMQAEVEKQYKTASENVYGITRFRSIADTIAAQIKIPNPTAEDFKNYTPKDNVEKRVASVIIANLKGRDYNTFKKEEIDEAIDHFKAKADYQYNFNYDPRHIVGDNYSNSHERFYGNNDVKGPDADHGTHVSGIIGALRDNNIGIKGVANDVMIMSVRTVPDGDERDKDVANAIRYAAANGAKVINMSFGKTYSWDKGVVDDAVKFAMSKDVLMIHGSGNDNINMDVETRYPNRKYADGGTADAWIEVGASGPKDDGTLKADFSNYGKSGVDVFAPGVDINSTTPNSTYTVHSGTSMASPVVAGLAALIRSYYPKLNALQVKEIILKSVTKVNHKVLLGGEHTEKVKFADLCETGGIVNVYNALQLAATY